MKLSFVTILFNVAQGDLIGWNRGRNTVSKHMNVRNKIINSNIIDQYRKFYNGQHKLQKLEAAYRKIRK